MAEEQKPADDPNAPWKLGWQEVAKASGTEIPEASPKQPTGVVETIKRAVKPWLMDWGVIAREAEKQAPKPSKEPTQESTPKEPFQAHYPTEKSMREAVKFTPQEEAARQAYMKSPKYIAELRDEIKKAPHAVARKALEEALAQALGK